MIVAELYNNLLKYSKEENFIFSDINIYFRDNSNIQAAHYIFIHNGISYMITDGMNFNTNDEFLESLNTKLKNEFRKEKRKHIISQLLSEKFNI